MQIVMDDGDQVQVMLGWQEGKVKVGEAWIVVGLSSPGANLSVH